MWNCNIDTRNGKEIKPDRYVVGWGQDRKHMLRFYPESLSKSNGADQSLNNPSVWAEFKANIKAAAKGRGIGS